MSAQGVRFRELTPTPLYTPDPEVPDEVYRSILPPIYLEPDPEEPPVTSARTDPSC